MGETLPFSGMTFAGQAQKGAKAGSPPTCKFSLTNTTLHSCDMPVWELALAKMVFCTATFRDNIFHFSYTKWPPEGTIYKKKQFHSSREAELEDKVPEHNTAKLFFSSSLYKAPQPVQILDCFSSENRQDATYTFLQSLHRLHRVFCIITVCSNLKPINSNHYKLKPLQWRTGTLW